LAAVIKQATGVESELIRGGGGIFDVIVDGDMIFSKHASERFPESGEILSKLRAG
jgi:predicted Rdx family selenoprotein